MERRRSRPGPLPRRRGVNLAVDTTSAAGLTVDIDRQRLGQVLSNLLNNALRHTPAGGTIQIDLAELPNGDAGVAVVDGGPGIPPEYAQSIFERFVQIPGAKTGTTGLGLSLAAEIARLHGGKLELANPGQPGARFACRLPRARP